MDTDCVGRWGGGYVLVQMHRYLQCAMGVKSDERSHLGLEDTCDGWLLKTNMEVGEQLEDKLK